MSINTYNPTTWENGVTAINQNHLNNIEQGIAENNRAILEDLIGGMKFQGEVSEKPTNNLEIGNVYQASAVFTIGSKQVKVGDLIVYTAEDTWNIIPSGDEPLGTVTQVIPGTGLSGSPITGSGSLNVDTSYINSLITTRFSGLANIASTGSWNDIVASTIPKSAIRPIYHATGDDYEGVMSQAAITNELSTKSDVGHTHETSDITSLNSLLATDGSNNLVKAASEDHIHGLITNDGKISGVNTQGVLFTEDGTGNIYAQAKVPSSMINGMVFGANENEVDIKKSRDYLRLLYGYPDNSDIDTYISGINWQDQVEGVLPIDEETGLLVPIAPSNHEHEEFSLNTAGFVPEVGEHEGGVILSDTGWVELSDTFEANEKNEFITYYDQDGSDLVEVNDGQLRVIILDSEPDDEQEFDYLDNCLYLIKG